MEREFIQKLTYNVNNGGTLELIQRGHDGAVLIADSNRETEAERKSDHIPAADMVMLINFYRHIKDNGIRHDFINQNGKNNE